jgi:hypothetical protein
MPCRNFFDLGECKFGDGCSFYHNDEEKRRLIDPLPNLPEGVTLPPMPEKLKNYKQKKAAGLNYDSQGESSSPGHYYSPMQNAMPMFTISNLTDIMALGGFNPNKYLTPQPIPMPGYYSNYGQVPPHLLNQQMPHFGNPAPFNGQKAQKKDGEKKVGEKKEKKKSADKKYVSKTGSPKKEISEKQ